MGQVSLFLGQVSTLTGYKTWGGRSFLSLFVNPSLNFKFSFTTLATPSIGNSPQRAVFASASLATAPLSSPTLALYLAPIKIQDELRNLHTRHTRVPRLGHNIRVLSQSRRKCFFHSLLRGDGSRAGGAGRILSHMDLHGGTRSGSVHGDGGIHWKNINEFESVERRRIQAPNRVSSVSKPALKSFNNSILTHNLGLLPPSQPQAYT